MVTPDVSPLAHTELVKEAHEAGLRYSTDERPGFTRKRRGKDFDYFYPNGRKIKDAATLARVRRLAIPPAYVDVWISPHENGHMQASARDDRGRKQYRYHAKWRDHRDSNKFDRILAFARTLPRIRERVDRDLRARKLTRRKVLATAVRLLEMTLIRVGNEEYVDENRSYGLTTLRNRHVRVRGPRLVFDFMGKSGQRHHIDVNDPQMARIVRECQELPGQHLFEYRDEEEKVCTVGSQDVNDYLRDISGDNYSAKDFRTWIGTVLAGIALRELDRVTSSTQGKKNVKTVYEAVAKMLGNTPAICRKCYVHPEITQAYLEGVTIKRVSQKIEADLQRSLESLRSAEAAVLVLLERRLKIAARKKGTSLHATLKASRRR